MLHNVIGTCKTLPEVSNGIVSYSTPATERNEYLADSVASYTCDEGFELFGTGMRMCQSNKTWSGVEPKCQGKWSTRRLLKVHISQVSQ